MVLQPHKSMYPVSARFGVGVAVDGQHRKCGVEAKGGRSASRTSSSSCGKSIHCDCSSPIHHVSDP